MRQVLASVSAVLASALLLLCGMGLLGTLLGVRLSAAGTDPFAIGVVMAAYFVGLLIAVRYADRLIRRVGHIRAFAALASILSAATLAHAFLPHPVFWGLLRFLEGVAVAGLFMCMESWLNDRAPNAIRGRVMSCYMIVVYAGLALGQFLLLVEDPDGFALFALASVVLSLALVPIALTRFPAPALPEATLFGLRQLVEISPLGVVGSFASGMMLGAVYGLAPAYTTAMGMDTRGTAFFMAAILFGGLILQWPIGRLSDIFDRRKVIASVAAAVALASGAMVVAGQFGNLVVLITAVLFGGAIYPTYPLSVTHANDYIPAEDLVSASGGLLVAYSVGAAIGPLVAGQIMSLGGPWGLFVLTGGAGAAMAAFTVVRAIEGRPAPAGKETTFLAVPRTSPYAAELDPRGADEEPELDFEAPEEEAETERSV